MPVSSRRRPRVAPALWIPAGLALGLLVLPLVALAVRAPWAQLPELLARSEVTQALALSLGTAAISTLVSLVLGIPLAVVLARSSDWPAVPRRLLRAFVTVPLVLPPVVGGVALLLLLGRRGLIGELLPFTIPFTTTAVVLAQVFVAMPFLVLAVEGALRASDRRFEIAAATLGASRFTVFRRVTVPLVAPGVSAGALLCFTRSLGEFGATITFAGSFPGVTQTLPVATYLELQRDPDAAIALSLVLMVVAVVVLVALRDRWTPGLRGMNSLTAHLDVTLGDFRLDLALTAEPGHPVALVGPNGAGKSTTVDALAGLLRLDAGVVRVGERILDDVSAGIHVPTEQRRVGVLFQQYLLFPHLTALENVAFGPRAAGVSRQDARAAASGWLATFGLTTLANRRPAELSGGQAQRVALARVLASEPDVLLLDEPLAALDVEVRDEVRDELAQHLAGFAGVTIVVTHSFADVEALGERVVVLEGGRVTHDGSVDELVAAPPTPYARRLVSARG